MEKDTCIVCGRHILPQEPRVKRSAGWLHFNKEQCASAAASPPSRTRCAICGGVIMMALQSHHDLNICVSTLQEHIGKMRAALMTAEEFVQEELERRKNAGLDEDHEYPKSAQLALDSISDALGSALS